MNIVAQTLYFSGGEISSKTLIKKTKIQTHLEKGKKYIKELNSVADHPDLTFVKTLLSKSEIHELEGLVSDWSERFTTLIVLGTGGSSLGGQTLCSILKYRKGSSSKRLRVKFLDNLGHHQMKHLFDDLDLSKTHFLVISKSGGTAETLAQCIISLNVVKGATHSKSVGHQFTAIVQPGDSALRLLASDEGFKIFDHSELLGGRFSVLSIVGLLPAITQGFKASLAVKGAKQAYDRILDTNTPVAENAPLVAAALQASLLGDGVNQSIFMPYESRLINFSRWYQQLWAESLGKEGKGTTPIRALGPLDQHSQLQLFLDGPRDKFFTFLLGNAQGVGYRINSRVCAKFGLDYLANRTIGDLVHAEAEASIAALVERGIPVRVMRYDKLEEDLMGELIASFMMETIFMANMMGVSPFGQPSVERSKILTKQRLSDGAQIT